MILAKTSEIQIGRPLSSFEMYTEPLPSIRSLDEAMKPYHGHHHKKQFIKGKPIKFGFKLWCLNKRDGYCVRFKLYEVREDLYLHDSGVTFESAVTK